jgi:hypothetical protein
MSAKTAPAKRDPSPTEPEQDAQPEEAATAAALIDRGIRLNVQVSHDDMMRFKQVAEKMKDPVTGKMGIPVTSWVRIVLRKAATS